MAVFVQSEIRNGATASDLKKLRRSGKIPAVIYGQGQETMKVAVEKREIEQLLQKNRNSMIRMELTDGQSVEVLIQEIQRDKVHRQIIHLDFHRIKMDEPVEVEVALNFEGEPIGVKEEGGVLQIQNRQIAVRCLPSDIPQSIYVDIRGLKAGQSLLSSAIELPSGLELIQDPSDVMVTVMTAQKLMPDEEEAIENREDAEKQTGQDEDVRQQTGA